jgi:hypothetical protein
VQGVEDVDDVVFRVTLTEDVTTMRSFREPVARSSPLLIRRSRGSSVRMYLAVFSLTPATEAMSA